MKRIIFALLFSISLASSLADAYSGPPIGSESRDASLAFVVTINATVSQIGAQCLSLLDRPESAAQYSENWRNNNAEIVGAAAIYMNARMNEAFEFGGEALKTRTMNALLGTANQQSSATTREWLEGDDKVRRCEHALQAIDQGVLDLNDNVPMYNELLALVDWATKQ